MNKPTYEYYCCRPLSLDLKGFTRKERRGQIAGHLLVFVCIPRKLLLIIDDTILSS